mmetsp:Transcript_20502/g.57753  ORF Transcript_20502/g.57753 Transcript_20502/m.57753 type:complete len:211 (-) Transcript_20502:532-1164(-)
MPVKLLFMKLIERPVTSRNKNGYSARQNIHGLKGTKALKGRFVANFVPVTPTAATFACLARFLVHSGKMILVVILHGVHFQKTRVWLGYDSDVRHYVGGKQPRRVPVTGPRSIGGCLTSNLDVIFVGQNCKSFHDTSVRIEDYGKVRLEGVFSWDLLQIREDPEIGSEFLNLVGDIVHDEEEEYAAIHCRNGFETSYGTREVNIGKNLPR